MLKWLKYLILSLLVSSHAQAVTCYITMVKGSCWKDYNLFVKISNADTGDKVTEIEVSKGELWARKSFSCNPGTILSMVASFSPAFWSGDEQRTYNATRFWKLPNNVTDDITGWNVTVCYPKWFSGVPYPPKASNECECDMTKIDKIAPKT